MTLLNRICDPVALEIKPAVARTLNITREYLILFYKLD
jgi:hypothetical protein